MNNGDIFEKLSGIFLKNYVVFFSYFAVSHIGRFLFI